jgi:WXG100 family type VII secretion target
MAPDPGDYSVDLGELSDVIGDLEGTERALETVTNDLERQIARLHETREGLSAQAQREAHEEWEMGMRDMRAALADMRAAAQTAHGNYSRAIATNVGRWRGI